MVVALITQAFYTAMGPRGITYAILFGTTVILIFGEIIPKTFAARFNTAYARIACAFLPLFISVLKPFILLAELITRPLIKARRSSLKKVKSSPFSKKGMHPSSIRWKRRF